MFEWIRGVIERLGYAGVAVLTFLENVFPPIPSELVIPLAGYVAARGEMQIALVIVVGSLGSLAGTSAWFVLGQRMGEQRVRAWVDRHGRWLTLSSRDLDRAQQWFERHGKSAVLLGRLVPGVRALISLPAGYARMPAASFIAFSLFGTVLWTAALAYAGVLLEANFAIVGDWINVATNIVLAIVVVLMVRRYANCWRSSSVRQSTGKRVGA